MSTMNLTSETRLSVRLKGPLAAHVDKQVTTLLYESHSEYVRDLIRRDMLRDEEYDLREGIIQGYADIAAGRYKENISHEDIFEQAVRELHDEGYNVET